MNKILVWPFNKIRFKNYFKPNFYIPRLNLIEKKLESMFPSGSPVLCSSGRAAINIVMSFKKQSRTNLIGVNTYTSHCVLDAISRLANPISWDPQNKNIKLRLTYHQWGYIQKGDSYINSIDDCVDTLCVRGTKLFPTSKDFEIWSLPKILGTSSGAILWCKDKNVAEKIRKNIDNRGGGLYCWILRVLGLLNKNFYWLWQGIEVQKGRLSKIELLEINNAIDNWEVIVKDRKIKLNLLWKFAPKWIKKPSKRLPCVVPLEYETYKKNKDFISYGIDVKHFEKVTDLNKRVLIKVFPVPCHQDIPIELLKEITDIL